MTTKVPVSQIEDQLRELWKDEASREDREAIVKACLLNLIIFSRERLPEKEQEELLSQIASHHPSRILVISECSETEAVAAQIEVRCHGMSGNRRQVCCEVIRISIDRASMRAIPSLVRSLAISDLPIVLWWKTTPQLEDELFNDLSSIADRTIINTSESDFGRDELIALARRLGNEHWTHLTDLNWSRLTPWRQAVAEFFDPPNDPVHLESIRGVQINYLIEESKQGPLPLRPLLAAAWLGSRLDWKVIEPLDFSPNSATLTCSLPDGSPVQITLQGGFKQDAGHGQLQSFQVVTETQTEFRTTFTAQMSPDGCHIATSIEGPHKQHRGRIFQLASPHAGELINIELDIIKRDKVYEGALLFAARCLKKEDVS